MSCLYPVDIFLLSKSHRHLDLPTVFHYYKEIPKNMAHLYYESVRPCQSCIECRLRKASYIATRCVHTASMYKQNSFLTLTYSDENLPSDLSISTDTMQKFWKKLRKKISPTLIKYYAAGEYGDGDGRRPINPHYHACVFGYDFPDKVLYKTTPRGDRLYTSPILSDLWGLGYAVIGDVTFESAAYVARYTLKKIYGDQAEAHYSGRLPEKSWSSNGLGKDWFEKFYTDVYPSDEILLHGGRKLAPPPYYDALLLKNHPDLHAELLDIRAGRTVVNKNNNSLERFFKNGIPNVRSVSDVVRRAQLRVGSLDKKR
nr:MAG: replication initiator protein [Microvirus sp.]